MTVLRFCDDCRKQYDEMAGHICTGIPDHVPLARGMTLRDHFAGIAMQRRAWAGNETAWEARECYRIADAMMEARKAKA